MLFLATRFMFTSAYNANEAALATLPKLLPGLIIFSDALNELAANEVGERAARSTRALLAEARRTSQ